MMVAWWAAAGKRGMDRWDEDDDMIAIIPTPMQVRLLTTLPTLKLN